MPRLALSAWLLILAVQSLQDVSLKNDAADEPRMMRTEKQHNAQAEANSLFAMTASGQMVNQRPHAQRSPEPLASSSESLLQHQREDCDETALPAPIALATSELAGFNWRVRLVTPCRTVDPAGGGDVDYEWEVHELELHNVSCSKASAAFDSDGKASASTKMVPRDYLSSGDTSSDNNKELTTDGQMSTTWKGIADSDGAIWLQASFGAISSVKCVRIYQCDCTRSARQFVLEVQDAGSSDAWKPASFASDPTVEFGEWTAMDVR